MDENQVYIQTIKINEIPWNRITTTYGRAADFPQYFKTIGDMKNWDAVKEALYEVTINIEHQSTLWHSTPFAIIFLVRIFKRAVSELRSNEIANFVVEQLLDLFNLVAVCFHDGDEMEHANQLSLFSDMCKEEYLWSEEYDEEKDEMRYEEDEVFPDDLFYSFYYYSYQALLFCKPILKLLENSAFDKKAKELYVLL